MTHLLQTRLDAVRENLTQMPDIALRHLYEDDPTFFILTDQILEGQNESLLSISSTLLHMIEHEAADRFFKRLEQK